MHLYVLMLLYFLHFVCIFLAGTFLFKFIYINLKNESPKKALPIWMMLSQKLLAQRFHYQIVHLHVFRCAQDVHHSSGYICWLQNIAAAFGQHRCGVHFRLHRTRTDTLRVCA